MDQVCYISNCQSEPTYKCFDQGNAYYICDQHLQRHLSSGENHNLRHFHKKKLSDAKAYISKKFKEITELSQILDSEVTTHVASIHSNLKTIQKKIKIMTDIYNSYKTQLDSKSKTIQIPSIKTSKDSEMIAEIANDLKHRHEELEISVNYLRNRISLQESNPIAEIANSQVNLVDLHNQVDIKCMKRSRDVHEIYDDISENQIEPRKKVKSHKRTKKIGNSLFHINKNGLLIKLYEYNNYENGEMIPIKINEIIDKNISMCVYRGNIFFYGNMDKNTYTGLTFSINTTTYNMTKRARGNPVYLPGIIYVDKCVYSFGGLLVNEKPSTAASKYDLPLDNWKDLKPMPKKSSKVSCFYFNNKIYLSGFHHSKVYYYSDDSFDYTAVLDVKVDMNKIITGTTDVIYVIESNASVFQSNCGTLRSFTVVSTANIDPGAFFGFKTVIDQ